MMGSLSPGLKQHAVTLYEAGKLNDASVAEMLEDLRQVEGTRMEGELQHFADHAFSLRYALQCLRESAQHLTIPGDGLDSPTPRPSPGKSPILKPASNESSEQLTGPLGADMAPPLSPLGKSTRESVAGTLPSPLELSPAKEGEDNIDDDKATTSKGAERARDVGEEAAADARVPSAVPPVPPDSSGNRGTGEEAAAVEGEAECQLLKPSSSPSVGTGREREPPRKWLRGPAKVDVLRCESLAGLARVTLENVLRRDYSAVVSMVPLAHPPIIAATDDERAPPHFGPPSPAAVTPWMKLLFYSVAGSGPVSVALVRGLRLRVLPPPLAGCGKALLWLWDGSSASTGVGFGNKPEGSLVDGSLLLHALNSLLKISAVLVQPLPEGAVRSESSGRRGEEEQDGRPVTIDLPLPLVQEEGPAGMMEGWSDKDAELARLQQSPSIVQAVEELQLSTIGYIRMLRTKRQDTSSTAVAGATDKNWQWVPQSVEFGIPLFDTDLARRVCECAKTSRLLEPQHLSAHRTAMQNLRHQLRSFIADYRANGLCARAAFDHALACPPSPSPWAAAVSQGSSPFAAGHGGFFGTSAEGVFDDMRGGVGRRRSEVLSFDASSSSSVSDFTSSRGSFFRKLSERVRRKAPKPGVVQGNMNMRIGEESPSAIFSEEQMQKERQKALAAVVDYDEDGLDVVLPGMNLLFDGCNIVPYDITHYLQGRQPAALVAQVAYIVESRRSSLTSNLLPSYQPA